MDYIGVLQEMLQYIDIHIKEKMNIEKLAKQAGFSPYYFCRIFQYSVGFSIMEYVRNRRLAYAASELDSRRKIIDIAIDYGFETHSGFSKAFRRYFGCPPEIYRAYASFDVPRLSDLSKTNQFISDFFMEPKIMVKKAPFKLAGFAFTANTEDKKNREIIPKLWEKYKADGSLEKLHHESFVKFHAEYGACFFKDYEDGESVFLVGLEAKPKTNIPFGYHVATIPKASFAVFTTPSCSEENFSSTIKNTGQLIFSEWLPNSGYEFDSNGVVFELYDERSTGDTDKMCDIYIPIINRNRQL